jgi:hypothetical protein
LELRKEKKTLDAITDWLVKDAGRRAMRDALIPTALGTDRRPISYGN